LLDLARGKRSAAISICDITRPAPNRVVLPHVLATLEQAGIPRSGITILIATGLHRAATEQELHTIVGPAILSRYTIASHDARDTAAHADLGTTRSGTQVLIDRRFVDSDLHISLGFIEPHLMLGFSGGRKLVAPGLLPAKKLLNDSTVHSSCAIPTWSKARFLTTHCITSY
jgi:nickel-dependent lactate racemase